MKKEKNISCTKDNGRKEQNMFTVSFWIDSLGWVKQPGSLKTQAEAVDYIRKNVPTNGKFKIDRNAA